MGYRWNGLDEPIFMAGAKPMRTEFGICQRLESCEVWGLFSGLNPPFFRIHDVRGAPPLVFGALVALRIRNVL